MTGARMLTSIHDLVEELRGVEEIVRSSGIPSGLKYVVLFSLAERVGALVIEGSDERKLKRMLCRMRSSTRVNRALAILRREGLLSEDEYRGLRRCLRAIRCLRNRFLHPVCFEKCPEVELGHALECVKRFLEVSAKFLGKD